MARFDFRPFPKLWEAFENDEAIFAKLQAGLPFEVASEASRRLATQSRAEARQFLSAYFGIIPPADEVLPERAQP